MTDTDIDALLDADRIAVVGCSGTPGKAAHDVPAYLRERGYDVVPVNPNRDEVLGRPAADSLADVSESVDLVDVFRPSEEVSGIVDAAIERSRTRGDVRGIWLQRGIRDDEAAARAREAGLLVVQDRCMKVEHRRRRGGE
ncbi:CoA-binding protein [Haloplanus halophilus]|uniref:CoA-binding protein n=1 Tax=Haloplanus halophilus TaxID=2949993 RepID=UPI00203BCD0E|nr:CoA-binding protein [Haloplanus sp. GDY1]